VAISIVAAALVGLGLGALQRRVVLRHSAKEGEPLGDRCPVGDCDLRQARGPLRGLLPMTGRCPRCAARVGPPPYALEVALALVFALLAWRFASWGELAAFCWLAVFAVTLAFVDVKVFRLPDALTLPAGLGTFGILLVTALVEQRLDDLARAALGAAAMAAFYLVLFVVNPAGIGFGDVKLGAVLGVALGWLGWTAVLAGGFLAFLTGAVYGVTMLLLGRAGRKTEIPFGPFMVTGALAAALLMTAT
jgi:leader peptidase (prepilin peptidase)/N-methyltransferase